ncbi:type VI secretion system ATPase TssH [Photobacterium leiognathi]|uniref:type VI secretion system ATPase TssH n=1 Tax=Photobacterium leiognathi TaxID=553611 RepID=UPI0029827086|nr:type VI secretion system ATPase TssH [Photobacterium leiognathi]
MIRIELPVLVNKLNIQTKISLEQAAALCMSRECNEVTIESFLFSLLENPLSDVRVLIKHVGLNSDDIKQLCSDAIPKEMGNDTYPCFSPLLIELLQEAWLLASTEMNDNELRSGIIFLAALIRPDRYLSFNLIKAFESINRESIRKEFSTLVIDSSETDTVESEKKHTAINVNSGNSALKRFCTNFTEQARQGKLDPVICRDNEINLMIDILCRRRKNNPIVVGDAGVGKSAVIEGLASRIVEDKVPQQLKNVELWALDLGLIQAGASIKGEFEKRLKSVLDEIKHSTVSVILFVDEAHTLIGSGNQEGSGDAANLLKPALARGELCTIAATTWKEYKKYFEKDPALTRRFQLVKLDEPTPEQAVDIMRGLHSVYENAHNVLISDDALRASAELSARYISGRQLPDKAIDVLDTACARIAINLSAPPRRIAEIESRYYQKQLEIGMLHRQQQLGKPVDEKHLTFLIETAKDEQCECECLFQVWQQQKALVAEIIETRQQILSSQNVKRDTYNTTIGSQSSIKEFQNKLSDLCAQYEAIPHEELLIFPEVDAAQIAQVIADWTGVPVNQMNTDELTKITELPNVLGEMIKGQDVALACIHRHLLTARADLRRSGRPQGAFLLVGPSGVGKTETVVQIAEQLYGGQQFLTTINMSEYQEKHTVSRLIGSPPGYVGFGDGGVLTEAIRKMPYSVVLLDEVEKAHPEVLNLFYQAFDKGELADGEGRIIDCQNILFFLTSNLGYQTIVDYAEQPTELEEKLYPELVSFFKPALLARMEIVPYLSLNKAVLTQIVDGKLVQLEKLLSTRYKADVVIESCIIEAILERATRAENGARMLEAIIEGQMLPPLSLALLNRLAHREAITRIRLTVEKGQFYSEVE